MPKRVANLWYEVTSVNKETTRIVIISSVLFTELFLHFQLKKNLAAGERTEYIKKKDIRQTDNQALEDGHSGLKVQIMLAKYFNTRTGGAFEIRNLVSTLSQWNAANVTTMVLLFAWSWSQGVHLHGHSITVLFITSYYHSAAYRRIYYGRFVQWYVCTICKLRMPWFLENFLGYLVTIFKLRHSKAARM